LLELPLVGVVVRKVRIVHPLFFKLTLLSSVFSIHHQNEEDEEGDYQDDAAYNNQGYQQPYVHCALIRAMILSRKRIHCW
jgi:hypothetical protein